MLLVGKFSMTKKWGKASSLLPHDDEKFQTTALNIPKLGEKSLLFYLWCRNMMIFFPSKRNIEKCLLFERLKVIASFNTANKN